MEQRAGCATDRFSLLFQWDLWSACMYLATSSLFLADGEMQKGVMISHRNVIANSLQLAAYEKPHREAEKKAGDEYYPTEIALGLLPQSHIYALVIICHAAVYRGDQVINLPKFDMAHLLGAVQRFKIGSMFLVCIRLVPPRDRCRWLRRQGLTLIV